jgi:hypothetical protein
MAGAAVMAVAAGVVMAAEEEAGIAAEEEAGMAEAGAIAEEGMVGVAEVVGADIIGAAEEVEEGMVGAGEAEAPITGAAEVGDIIGTEETSGEIIEGIASVAIHGEEADGTEGIPPITVGAGVIDLALVGESIFHWAAGVELASGTLTAITEDILTMAGAEVTVGAADGETVTMAIGVPITITIVTVLLIMCRTIRTIIMSKLRNKTQLKAICRLCQIKRNWPVSPISNFSRLYLGWLADLPKSSVSLAPAIRG